MQLRLLHRNLEKRPDAPARDGQPEVCIDGPHRPRVLGRSDSLHVGDVAVVLVWAKLDPAESELEEGEEEAGAARVIGGEAPVALERPCRK